jgi:DUF2993 family protein
VSDYPTQRLPIQPGDNGGPYGGYDVGPGGRPRRSRGRRALIITLVTLVVLAALFVIADRVAVRVDIQGFPFLTQLAAREFNEVRISAPSEQAGPVEIKNLQATMHQMKLINGFSGAHIGSLNGTGLITFASLAKAAGVPGLKISALNNTEAKVTVDLDIISASGVARVTKVGDNKLNIAIVNAGGIPLNALGGLNNMTITIPGVPVGLKLASITMTSQGILIHITGHNVTLSNG